MAGFPRDARGVHEGREAGQQAAENALAILAAHGRTPSHGVHDDATGQDIQ